MYLRLFLENSRQNRKIPHDRSACRSGTAPSPSRERKRAVAPLLAYTRGSENRAWTKRELHPLKMSQPAWRVPGEGDAHIVVATTILPLNLLGGFGHEIYVFLSLSLRESQVGHEPAGRRRLLSAVGG